MNRYKTIKKCPQSVHVAPISTGIYWYTTETKNGRNNSDNGGFGRV